MRTNALPYVAFLSLLFGSTLIASRFSVGQYEPSNYIALRLTLAAAGHMAIYALPFTRRRWPRDSVLWQRAALLGVFGTAVPMLGIVSALQYLSSGLVAILLTTGPAFTVIFAHLFLPDESLNRKKAVGVVVALSGTLILALNGESGLPDVSSANPLGYVLVIGAMVCSSLSSVYIRKFLNGYNTYDVASIRMFSASLFMLPLAAFVVGFDLSEVTRTGYVALFYAALVGTFSGFLLSIYLIRRFGATASAMTAYLIPIVAGVGGVLLLNEQITTIMFIGMMIIIAGVAIINRNQQPVTVVRPVAGD